MPKTNYLEQLKQLVSSAFADAESKEDIDKCSQIEQAIKAVESEQTELMEKNKELISAYKDAVMHPGVSKEKEPEPTTLKTPQSLSFEDFVASHI